MLPRRLPLLLLVLATRGWCAPLPPAPGPDAAPDAGLVLLGEANCTACHPAAGAASRWLVPRPAPRLDDLAGRASPEWARGWLLNPPAAKPGAAMPDLLARYPADRRQEIAEALTHFLYSAGPARFERPPPDARAVARGEALFRTIGCAACHPPAAEPGEPQPASPPSLADVAAKWSFPALRDFLRDPLKQRPAGRMPSLDLTEAEAGDIASWLLRPAGAGSGARSDLPAFRADPEKAARGREWFVELRCAACHDWAGVARPAPGPALADLNSERGCLADTRAAAAPDFHWTASRRAEARAALLRLRKQPLDPPTPRQAVAQTMAAFDCYACHARQGVGGVSPDRGRFFTSNGQDLGDEGRLPPTLDDVGDKLRPAWIEGVLTKSLRVRPYLNTRMPQFGAANVGRLPELFVAADRPARPAAAAAEGDPAAKEAGRKLVGTGGLSCVVCHRFNRQPAQTLQVADLTTVPDRLNEDWFRRFLLDPNRFHPGTRMPAFWPERRSLLPAVLGGDTDKQVAAVWSYLSDGAAARPPAGMSRASLELVVGDAPVVYRGKMWEAGFRALAVGYPGQVNLAFDAEDVRLSLLWRGRFLDPAPHWRVQGMGQIRPLSRDPVVFPHGPAFAALASADAPWPREGGREAGVRFGGYELDGKGRPTLLYRFRGVGVEDFFEAGKRQDATALRRTLKFSGEAVDGLYFRIAAGKLTPADDDAWRYNDSVMIRLRGQARAMERAAGDGRELIVPVRLKDGHGQVEVDYVW